VAKGRNQRRAVVNTILKLRFHKRRWIFFTISVTVGFSMTLIHGIIKDPAEILVQTIVFLSNIFTSYVFHIHHNKPEGPR
jgi:hypothetical protein